MTTVPKTLGLDADLHRYLVAHGTPPDPVLNRLIDRTADLGGIAVMQIAPEQGAFLTMLAQLLNATRIVEVGTFTGYSAICLARGLNSEGTLICCDVSEEYTAIAAEAWEEAGLTNRIELHIAPAAETLASLPFDPPIDLAFIDADKSGYAAYYELILERMRPGGVIALDNVLWGGRVIDDSDNSADTLTMRTLNAALVDDHRVDIVMLPLADGLTLCRKKG